VPHVIQKEGLGYYGIQLDYLPCKVNGNAPEPLGQICMAGDIENWQQDNMEITVLTLQSNVKIMFNLGEELVASYL
jgi:hypothetical protein